MKNLSWKFVAALTLFATIAVGSHRAWSQAGTTVRPLSGSGTVTNAGSNKAETGTLQATTTNGNITNSSGLVQAKAISPADGTIFSADNIKKPIFFRWTPVAPSPQVPITYHIQIFEVLPGQTPMQAFRGNRPILEQSGEMAQAVVTNLVTGSCKSTHRCDFIWTVQALDRQGKLIGVDGSSGITDKIFGKAIKAVRRLFRQENAMKAQLKSCSIASFLLYIGAAIFLPSIALAADLSVVQTGPVSATAGATVSYTLHSATNGPYTLPNGVVTTVKYTAAPGFTSVSASGPTWSCGPAISNVVTCTRSLAIGANTAYPDITVTATASAAGLFQNCANIKFDPNPTTQPDQNPANDNSCINGEIAPGKQANVTATKTCAVKGQAVQCTVTITNNTPGTPSAVPISVTDTLTGAISTGQYTGASGTLSPLSCSPGAGAIVPVTCTSTTPVLYGSPQTVVFSYLFPTGAQLKNCATITTGKAGVANPPITACSPGVIVDKPTTAPDLQVTKRCSVSAQTVLCTVMIKNIGTATATGPIGLSDTVTGAPSDGKYTGINSTLASSSCFPGVASPIPPISCITSASISPGNTGEFQFTFVLPKGGTFKNCATSTLAADSNTANNTNICVTVTVQAPAQNGYGMH